MDPMTLRLSERILDVLIGGICIYLGYRLFFRISAKTDSSGKDHSAGEHLNISESRGCGSPLFRPLVRN